MYNKRTLNLAWLLAGALIGTLIGLWTSSVDNRLAALEKQVKTVISVGE
jgi:hypothetical protein